LNRVFLTLFLIFFLAGAILDMNLLFAIGWVFLVKAMPIEEPSSSELAKLLVIPFFGFPWVSFDANGIGWTFRLTGAQVTAQLFSLLNFNVIQEGTQLLINKLPISVEAACAGLNTLQSMMILGLTLAYMDLKHSILYWFNIPLLLFIAWIANTIRIIMISSMALYGGREFALGPLHSIGGLAVIFIMFMLAWGLIKLQKEFLCAKSR
ncbi:MAG: archaeosortase/exosortase family protein, partial [Parachlamydiaceae bacterium]